MLGPANRLRDSAAFTRTSRSGVRAGTSRLVVFAAGQQEPGPTRVGLVVSTKVGNSVVRKRVSRQLRHLMRERLQALGADGFDVVIRALPASAGADSSQLGDDLDSCLRRLRRRLP